MSTPTSPGTPPEPAVIALPDALAAIGQGDFSRRILTALSDLDRPTARGVSSVWPTWPVETRRRLIVALDELAETQVILTFGRVLANGLDDPDAVVRHSAIAAMWEDESHAFLNRLIELLGDESQDVRAEAARGLGRFSERAAADDLDEEDGDRLFAALESVAADEHEEPFVRRRALESVASFGDRGRTHDLIRDAYDADDARVRAGAICAMGRSLDSRWVPTIVEEFESDDPELRYEAARAAGEVGDDDAVPGLGALTNDEDPEVRFAAISALGLIGSTAATRVLHRLLENADPEDREAIEEALEIADDLPGAGD
jgi:HEAT repeat protein